MKEAAWTETGFVLHTAPALEDISMEGRWDELWLATGKRMNIAAEAVLAPLACTHPVQAGHRVQMLLHWSAGQQHRCANVCVLAQVVGGYPVMTDSLAWPGLPLFIIGRAALLQLGPAAGLRSSLIFSHFGAWGLKLGT